uniref:Uncharacterized protein n=1 Tax=Pristionchus pacificus TaxID=54126 RepID=A0A2A6BYK5_PRIPA|eukprot:PDM70958.1 hypothetical protein PRIPAC_44354 [Pristionchus pacificus]
MSHYILTELGTATVYQNSKSDKLYESWRAHFHIANTGAGIFKTESREALAHEMFKVLRYGSHEGWYTIQK